MSIHMNNLQFLSANIRFNAVVYIVQHIYYCERSNPTLPEFVRIGKSDFILRKYPSSVISDSIFGFGYSKSHNSNGILSVVADIDVLIDNFTNRMR